MKKTIFLFFVLIASVLLAQNNKIYFDVFASKYSKSDPLLAFIHQVSASKKIGIIRKNLILNEPLVVDNLDNCHLVFQNNSNISISKTTRVKDAVIQFNQCKNITIEAISMDLKGTQLPIYNTNDYPNLYNVGLMFRSCSNINIINSKFSNLYTRSIFIHQSTGNITIQNTLFLSPKQKQDQILEHIVIGSSPSANININNNVFRNDAYDNPRFGVSCISTFGIGQNGTMLIENNVIENAGRSNDGHHRLYAIDLYDDCSNFVIRNNVLKNIMWGAIRFDNTKENALIENNSITVINADDSGVINTSTKPVSTVFKNLVIRNNQITATKAYTIGILVQSTNRTPIADAIIENNVFNNLDNAISLIGNIKGIQVNNNVITGNLSRNAIKYEWVDNLKNDWNNAEVGGFNINDNVIEASHSGVNLSIGNPRYQNNFRYSYIQNNKITNINQNKKGFGIVIGFYLDNKIDLSNNQIKNMQIGLYLRSKQNINNLQKIIDNTTNILQE